MGDDRTLRWLVLAVLILTAFPVNAKGNRCLARWIPDNPQDYQFDGYMDIIATDQLNVVEKCEKLLGRELPFTMRGCAKRLSVNYCRIIVVNTTYKCATTRFVIEHEKYHCGGWIHN